MLARPASAGSAKRRRIWLCTPLSLQLVATELHLGCAGEEVAFATDGKRESQSPSSLWPVAVPWQKRRGGRPGEVVRKPA